MQDYKSQVNVTFPGPTYRVEYDTRQNANKMFVSEVVVKRNGEVIFWYNGQPRLNKKEAEQSAAAGLVHTTRNT